MASESGDWLLVEEMLERGDPEFVDALRAISDAERLAGFAVRWYTDATRRAEARRLLLDYLDRPLNAFRHEPLVKRLFKQAEAAGDDEVMARFLVLLDRSIRRGRGRRYHFESQTVKNQAQAVALVDLWRANGFETAGVWTDWKGQHHVSGRWSEEAVVMPANTTMPRYDISPYHNPRSDENAADLEASRPGGPGQAAPLPEGLRKKLTRLRLYSVATRQYLRRRAWRYFRKLGKSHPDRYVPAVSGAIVRYRDEDVSDGLALIDNWGLMHALFHHSPVLTSRAQGWKPAEGRSLAELKPAPLYAPLWKQAPRAVAEVLVGAQCRPVRLWAIEMIRRDPAARASLTVDEILGLFEHDDPDVAAFADEQLREASGLDQLGPDRWLALAGSASAAALDALTDLMRRHLGPDRLSVEQVARLAASRPLPLARLGLDWLQGKEIHTEDEARALLALTEAEAEPLRPEIIRRVRERLSAAPGFRPDWVLELLDGRHADVRAEGLAWLRDEPRVRDDVTVWQKLLESPYDDVRFALVAELEARVAGRDPERAGPLDLDSDAIRLLWATVLLNIHRGGRAKPVVLRQLLRRGERRPDELPGLLPLLAVALRSTRGPEWRAGLAAVVQLVERRPETAPLVGSAFPELKWT